jgi:hypothetical protein
MFYQKWCSTFVSKEIPAADFILTNPKIFFLQKSLHAISNWENIILVFN